MKNPQVMNSRQPEGDADSCQKVKGLTFRLSFVGDGCDG